VALVGRPLAGYASDRVNKRNLLIIATAGLGLSVLGYGISTNSIMLLAFRILHGFFFTFSSTASTSLGTTYIPKDRLGEGISFLGLGYILALAIGPNLGIMIAGPEENYRGIYWAAFAFSAVAATLMTLLHSPKAAGIQDKRKQRKFEFKGLIAKEVIMLAAIGGFFSLMNGLISTFLVNMADEKHITGYGAYFIVNSIGLFVVRFFAGRLLDRKGLAAILFPAFALCIVAGIFLGAAPSLPLILVAAALYAFGQGASQPAIQTSCIRMTGPDRVGVATSTYFIGADIGMSIGPMLGGAVAGTFGFSSLYFIGSGALFIGLTFFYFYNRKHIREDAATDPVVVGYVESNPNQGK
jgi:MFS family permease